ncbi:MAG: hypothetical protein JW838_04825 [Spirochaetes bacterium]|nr:hypothetical protein [Spirochaetota bacterium]
MKTKISAACIALLVLAAPGILRGRDIDLDAVYIDTESDLYRRLVEKKLEAYQKAGAQFVDRDVIFAWWSDGFTILYVKELRGTNIVYSYDRNRRRSREIARVEGALTGIRSSLGGRYVFIKRIMERRNAVPKGETLMLDLRSREQKILEPAGPFIDFSLSPGGNAIIYESKNGMLEYSPGGGRRTSVVVRSAYSDMARSGDPVIAHLSPNRRKILFVSGSGGSYRARLSAGRQSRELAGITSSSELFWIDNDRVACRRGGAGNYTVEIFNAATGRFNVLLEDSLNTNICYSPVPGMLSFLHQQMIHFYDVRSGEHTVTGIEGEDVGFSPDGNRFISLYLKRLFLTGTVTSRKKRPELAAVALDIAGLYKKVLDSGKVFSNDYSKEYARKKIYVYRKFAR